MHDNRIDKFETFRDLVQAEFKDSVGCFEMFFGPKESDEHGSATVSIDPSAFKSDNAEGILKEALTRLHFDAEMTEVDSKEEYAYAELPESSGFTLLWVTPARYGWISLMVTIN